MSYEKLADGSASGEVSKLTIAEAVSLIKVLKNDLETYQANKGFNSAVMVFFKLDLVDELAQTCLINMVSNMSILAVHSNQLDDGSQTKSDLHRCMRDLSQEILHPDDSIRSMKEYKIVKDYYDKKKLGDLSTIFESANYLHPFNNKPVGFEHQNRFHQALFWVTRTVQCALWPVRFVGWLVRNALRGFFFAVRHPKFWEWGNVNDQDADLNPQQKFIKDIAKGFDNFLEANTEMLSRPLDIIEMIFKFVAMDNKWEKIKKAVIDKFNNEPVTSWTAIFLFAIQIALAIALPVALLTTSASVAVGVGGATRHLMVPGVGCAAVAAAVAPSTAGGLASAGVASGISPSLTSGMGLCTVLEREHSGNEVEGLEQALILLYKNSIYFSEEKYNDLHHKIRLAIAETEERLQLLNPAHYLEAREAHVATLKQIVELMRKNLTERLRQSNPALFEKISQKVDRHEREIKSYEIRQLAETPLVLNDFVWIKSLKESSFAEGGMGMFSGHDSNQANSNNDDLAKDKVSSPSMRKE